MVHGLHSYFHSKQKRLHMLAFIWNADISVKAPSLKLIVQLKSNHTLFPLQGAFSMVFPVASETWVLYPLHISTLKNCQVNLFTILNCYRQPGRLANEVLAQPPLGLPPSVAWCWPWNCRHWQSLGVYPQEAFHLFVFSLWNSSVGPLKVGTIT